MKSIDRPIQVVAGQVVQKTCREACCRRPIDLRLLAKNGKPTWMPFSRGAVPLHSERDERGVRYELMSRDDLHFVHCEKRRQAAGQPGAHA